MLNRQLIRKKNEEGKLRIETSNIEGREACFKNLFIFVSKNKRLINKLDSFDLDDILVKRVHSAIRQANWDNEALKSEDATSVILFLIAQDKLTFSQGMNAYFNIIAMQSFSLFNGGSISFKPIIKHKNLTTEASELLRHINSFSEVYGLKNISTSDFKNFVAKLSKQEKYLVELEYDFVPSFMSDYHGSSVAFLDGISSNVPYMSRNTGEQRVSVVMPSFSIVSYLHHMLLDNPVEMTPIFGDLGLDSLAQLHRLNIHPVSLYNPNISSNLATAHSYPQNPLNFILHDFAHSFWGGMLSLEARRTLFDFIIPSFKLLPQQVQFQNFHKNMLSEPHEMLIDFDLSPVRMFVQADARLVVYVARSMSHSSPSLVGKGFRELIDSVLNCADGRKKINDDLLSCFALNLLHFTQKINGKNSSSFGIFGSGENVDTNTIVNNINAGHGSDTPRNTR